MKNIFLTLLLLSFFLQTKAQLNNPDNWRYHKAMEGVNCHFETAEELWLGTNAGLVTVDKTTLERNINTKENSSIPSNTIESIQVDLDGNTWIGTYDYIIARKAGDDWVELPIPVDPDAISSTTAPRLFDFEIASDGSFWLATNNGLWHYDSQIWEVYNHWQGNLPSSFDFGEFWSVEEVNGEVYFSGFELYKIVDNEVINLTTDFPMCTFYVSGNIISQNDKIYVTDFFTFIATFENNSTTIVESAFGGFPNANGFRISPDGNDQLHVLFNDGEKYLLDGSNWTNTSSPLSGQLDAFGQENAYYYFHNQNNQEWFSHRSDLYKLSANSYDQIALSDNPLLQNNGKQFAAASDNSVYVFENQTNMRLSRFHPAEGWSQIHIPEVIDGQSIYPRSIVINTENQVILAASSQLATYDGSTWTLVPGFPLSNCHLVSKPTAAGKYHVGNTSEIVSFDGQNWEVLDPPFTVGTPDYPNEIKTLATAPNGDLWVSRKYDFLRYDSNNQWTVFDEDDTNVVTSSAVVIIDFEENGTVWMTAAADGILRFENNDWTLFDQDEGVDGCRDLTVTPEGEIWAATFDGLAKFNGNTWDLWTADNSELRGEHILQVSHSTDGTLWINADQEGVQLYSNNGFTSGDSQENFAALALYPNPATDYIFIENAVYENEGYQILNNLGQIVKRGIIRDQVVDLASLSAGVYFVKMERENELFIGKVVKR